MESYILNNDWPITTCFLKIDYPNFKPIINTFYKANWESEDLFSIPYDTEKIHILTFIEFEKSEF